jgi:hypothetical protein
MISRIVLSAKAALKSKSRCKCCGPRAPIDCLHEQDRAPTGGFRTPVYPSIASPIERHLSRSRFTEIEVVLRVPCRERVALPLLRPQRQGIVPRPRLKPAQLGDVEIHVGVELDEHLVGIEVVGSKIVSGRVPREPPDDGDFMRSIWQANGSGWRDRPSFFSD